MAAKCPVIGLAGGIGSGKSAAAAALARLGAVVTDADSLAQILLDRDDVIATITSAFGADVLDNGRISRPLLAARVFSDSAAVRRLNGIIHPEVISQSRRIIDAARADGKPAVVLDAPLLFEAGLDSVCDAVIFVDADDSTRFNRVAASRGWDASEVHRRQNFQDSLISKRDRADYIIDNNGSLDDLARQAADIFSKITGA